MRLYDQYDRPVPDDLVLLPDPSPGAEEAELAILMNADWYEADGVLLVSGAAIDWMGSADPLDAGVDLRKVDAALVDDALKRYSPEDGFYHA